MSQAILLRRTFLTTKQPCYEISSKKKNINQVITMNNVNTLERLRQCFTGIISKTVARSGIAPLEIVINQIFWNDEFLCIGTNTSMKWHACFE